MKAFSSNGDFSSILETLANSEKQEKEESCKDWKERNKTTIIHIWHDRVYYTENPRDSANY